MTKSESSPAPAPAGASAGAAAGAERYHWREFAASPTAIPRGDDERAPTAAEIGGAVALAWQSGRKPATETEGTMPQRFTAEEMAELVRAYRAYTPPAPEPAPAAPYGVRLAQARRQQEAERLARREEGRH